MKDYLKTANSKVLWIAAIPVVVIVIIQAMIFYKKAKNAGKIVGLSDSDAKRAFKVGAKAAIGPAIGVFVVMLGLMAVIGAPLSWMRLSVIGAAPTELAASQMAAKAQNIELTDPNYDIMNFANATWVMALNGSAWLLVSGLFADKLEGVQKKAFKGKPKKLSVVMSTAMCGAFAYLLANQVYPSFVDRGKMPYMVAGIVAIISMYICEKISKKHPKMKEWNLGISMIVAMFLAIVYKKLIMGV